MRRRFCRPPRLAMPSLFPAEAGEAAPSPPDAAPVGRRFLALLFPRLPVDRLRRPGPVAVWSTRGSRRILASVSPEAEAAGLEAGQALADAQAILPGVTLVPEDPAGDALALERLALWALRFTPLVGVAGPHALLLDITGVGHLFDGEAALREAILARLARMGLSVTGAVAGSAGTALALVRAGWGGTVAPGREATTVAPLSLAALALDAPLVAGLHGLGLRDVGSVAAQPRAALVRRFGPALARALDEALGHIARPITPIRTPPEMAVEQGFAEPVVTRAGIEAALALLLEDLCRVMRDAGRGARRVLLRAHRIDGDVQDIAIGTGLATRDARHLARLFHERLERLEPDGGFDRLALEASRTDPLIGAQDRLHAAGGAERREDLARLLDRLSQRLAVWRLAPRASHWPERAMARVGAFDTVALPEGWAPRPRPVRLLRRPPALQVMAQLPDAPPFQLRLGRHWHRVLRAEEAERIEPEWWRDRPDRLPRDYYQLEMESGARLWVCRAGPMGPAARWVLHGHLP